VSASTWTWVGGNINMASASDWSLFAGPGNPADIPAIGDTVINTGVLTGYGLIAASTIVNSGTIEASNNLSPASSTGGELEIGAVSGSGSMTIEPGATLRIDGALGAGQSIEFAPTTPGEPETLILGSPSTMIPNAISGYGFGDKIEFSNGVTITSANLDGDTLAIVSTTATYDLTDIAFASAPLSGFDAGYIDPFTDYDWVMPNAFSNWTGDGSDTNFGTAANWSAGVPNADDFATFGAMSLQGGTISGTGTALQLSIRGTGTWTLAQNATLTATVGLFVGSGGHPGTLTVGSGNTILTGGYLDVGNLAGSNGQLTVNGGVIRDTGPAAPGILAIVGVQAATAGTMAATGTVTVTAGGTIDLGDNALALGYGTGTSGDMTISAGGSVNATTRNSNIYAAVAIGRLGSGTLTVTDAGSQLTANGNVYVARSMASSLTVEASARFIVTDDATGQANVLIGDGNTTGVGGTGIAAVATGGELVTTGGVSVGTLGTSGQLNVNGGTVQVGTTLTVATGGTIGNGATETGSGALTIGADGTAELTGTAQTAAYGVVLGNSNIGTLAVETAVASVTGPAALLNTNDNGLAVGLFGSASLTVSAGGSVLSGIAAPGSIAALSIGNQGTGTVSVSGAGSQLVAAGNLAIGASGGTGGLSVSNSGAVTITGPVTMAGAAAIQDDGTGEIEIGGSGHAVAGEMVIDSGGAVSGFGLLSGAIGNGGGVTASGGTLELSGAVTGAGTLSIAGQATLKLDSSAASTQSIGFAPSGTDAVLTLGMPLAVGALIENFAATDSITFVGSYGSVGSVFSGDTMEVLGDGATIASLDLTQGYSTANTQVSDNAETVTITARSAPIITVANTVTVAPPSGSIVSLDRLLGDPRIAPGGTIQSLLVNAGGTATVAGTGSINNLEVGNGELLISGGTVNTDPVTVDSSGDIAGFGTITGAVTNQGTVTASGGTLIFTGLLTGPGTLSVAQGAMLVLQDGGGGGATTVNGGSMAAGGVFDVNAPGLGGLLVENAGTFQSGTSAGGSAGGLDIAAASGQAGAATVIGAKSLLSNTGEFVVGDQAVGSLSIEAGGTVTTSAGAVIGNTASASGSSVNLSGTGSALGVTGTMVVGAYGFGSLSLSQGASVTAGALDVAAAGGAGAVSLAGAGTTLNITGSLILGDQSAGELSVLGGAHVTVGGGLVGGTGASAAGNLDIEGAGSLFDINGGSLVVGATGPAQFTLGIGATLKGQLVTAQFGVTNLYGNVDPQTDPVDGTQNVGFNNSLIYDFYVANSGIIKVTSESATFYTPQVTFETGAADSSTNGLWVIGANDTLVMNAMSVDNSQTFDLTSAVAATLVIGQVPAGDINNLDTLNGITTPTLTGSIAAGAANVLPGWAAPIENYQSGDMILLQGLTYGSANVSGDVVTVWSGPNGTGNNLGSLTFIDKSDSSISAAAANEAAAAAAQINALASLPCFAAGTRIATTDGWVAVEDLVVGDQVQTAHGPCEPIVWVGSRTVDCARHLRPETVRPVRVSAGAFGENVPLRDLYLSPDHAVFVNGALVPVKLLIDGTGITQVKRDYVTYHHVELPEHTVILAEGLTVESYLGTGDRANFGGEIIRLFPDFAARLMTDTATVWETRGAAPLVLAGPKLAAARQKGTACHSH
jgi:T5SS/PEP-CTERM-associated repeat protein